MKTNVWYNLIGDSMKIKTIKKMAKEKYQITFDDGEKIILQDQIILDHNILYKKEIDDELKEVLLKENVYYEVYNKTVTYIMKRLRSEEEVRKYLIKYELKQKDIDSIVAKLKSIHLIDDLVYAKSFTSDKLNFTNDGPLKIKSELEKNNIDSNIIEEVIESINLDNSKDKIIRYIEKKIRLNKNKSLSMLKQKLLNDLSKMGYPKDFIYDCFNVVEFIDNDVITKEYNKVYLKLSKKYSGNELNYKIREKLFKKGFESSEITDVINKNS